MLALLYYWAGELASTYDDHDEARFEEFYEEEW